MFILQNLIPLPNLLNLVPQLISPLNDLDPLGIDSLFLGLALGELLLARLELLIIWVSIYLESELFLFAVLLLYQVVFFGELLVCRGRYDGHLIIVFTALFVYFAWKLIDSYMTVVLRCVPWCGMACMWVSGLFLFHIYISHGRTACSALYARWISFL